MRIPSGLSSHGPELTSHYCKDNAEKRLSHSAQDTLKINQGSVKHYSALLISLFLDKTGFHCHRGAFLCMKYFMFRNQKCNLKPSFHFSPIDRRAQLWLNPSLPLLKCVCSISIFHSCSLVRRWRHLCRSHDTLFHSDFIRPQWGSSTLKWPSSPARRGRTKETKEPGRRVKADNTSCCLVLSAVPSTTQCLQCE